MDGCTLEKIGLSPYAAIVESDIPIGKVVEAAKELSHGCEAIVALRPSEGIEARLVPAYLNACIRCSESAMHSGSLSIEMLLFIAADMNIGSAIKKAAADASRFIILASSKSLAERLIETCKLRKEKDIALSLDVGAAGDIAVTAIKDDK